MVSTDLSHVTSAGDLVTGDRVYTVRGGNSRNVRVRSAADQVWFDIRDYGDISSGDITTALQATINAIGAGGMCKTIMIPQVPGIATMTQGAITLPDPTGDPGWTLLYGCKRIQFTSMLSLKMGTTVRGVFGSGMRGQGTGAIGPNGPHFVGDSIAAGLPVIEIRDVGSCRLDNLTIEPGGGASIGVLVHRANGMLITNCSIGGGTNVSGAHAAFAGLQPAIKFNGGIWGMARDCRFSSGDHLSPSVWFLSDVTNSDQGGGIYTFENIVTAGFPFKLGPSQYGSQFGNIHILGCVCENMESGQSMILLDGTYLTPEECTFERIQGADSSNTYLLNVINRARNIRFQDCGLFTMDPASAGVSGLQIGGGAAAGGGGNGITVFPPYSELVAEFPGVLDKRLVATPRSPQWIMGTVLNVQQDGVTGAFNTTDTTLASGILAPDGTTNAFSLTGTGGVGSNRWIYAVDRTVAVGDWFIFGCWVKAIDDVTIDFFGIGVFQHDLAFGGNTHGTNTGGSSAVMVPEDSNIHDGAWHWVCRAIELLTLGTGTTCNVRIIAKSGAHTIGFFNPCAQYIPVTSGVKDHDVLAYSRSLKGGWATQNNVAAAGTVGILDHQQLRGNTILPPRTVATLPATPIAGMVRYVTDSATTTFGAIVTAGSPGSRVKVWYNGTNWTVTGV